MIYRLLSTWLKPATGSDPIPLTLQVNPIYGRFQHSLGKRLAIVLSGQVLMNPIIKSKIDSGRIGAGVWDSPVEALKIAELLLETSGGRVGQSKE